ncbi:MAG TPA: glutaredoxin family protein [Thiobacillaceae bacterium]|nr:glutaredoxin family protein [Thiobacillaceae bacterium]
MKAQSVLLLLMLTLPTQAVCAAQLYRWVDANGTVHYSDQPPPPSTKKVQRVGAQANVVETDKESYAMKQARQNSPVILYVTECGVPCKQARDFLGQRHIPFQTKNPENVPEDAIELKKLIGALEVPVIKVGSNFHKGFEALSWENLLHTAGYPLTDTQAAKH